MLLDKLIIGSWQFFIHFDVDKVYVVGNVIVNEVAPVVANEKDIVSVVG